MASWSVIVGAAGTEKGAVALRVARALEQGGLAVGGFVQEEVVGPEGEPVGWDVVRVTDGCRSVLARRSEDETMCGYRFEDSGFATAREWAMCPADVVVVGGVGKLESARRGNWSLLESLVNDVRAPHVVSCVRDTSLATIALSLPNPTTYVELPCSDATLEAFVSAVRAAVGRST